MIVNWFTPVPPSDSEIGNYYVRLSEELQSRVEVRLWYDDATAGPGFECDLDARDIRTVQAKNLNDADVNVYNIGNNVHFHSRTWWLSRQHAGVVILHDTHLFHLLAMRFVGQLGDRAGFIAMLDELHGATRDGERFVAGEIDYATMAARYPLTRAATDGALGVVVHSEAAAVALAGSATRITRLHLPIPTRPLSRRWREEHDGRPWELIVFGYLGSNRRVDSIIRALGRVSRPEEYRLRIFGKIQNEPAIRSAIEEIGGQRIVTLHGFVPESELDAAIERADLAFNLRYPSMGEASAAQLRIWERGAASLVTPIGWYAELPGDVAFPVRIESELDDLVAHLEALRSNPERYARCGRAGRELVEANHSPRCYVDSLVEFLARMPRAGVNAQLLALADNCAERIRPWLTDERQLSLFGRSADQIAALSRISSAAQSEPEAK